MSEIPAIEEINFANKTFSIRTNKEITAIQRRFIMPETKSRIINIQQQPRQYTPFCTPIRKAPLLPSFQY